MIVIDCIVAGYSLAYGGGIARKINKGRALTMEEKLKWLFSIMCGLVATFTEKYGMMIALVCVAIVFDVATGLIKAKITGTVSSSAGTRGMFKKMALLICLFFGFFLDFAIPYMASSLGIDIPFNTPFGLIICFYIVINECISICENLYACDENIMPKWIVNILLSTKEKLEEDGEDDE